MVTPWITAAYSNAGDDAKVQIMTSSIAVKHESFVPVLSARNVAIHH
jgi:hypothetical protein